MTRELTPKEIARILRQKNFKRDTCISDARYALKLAIDAKNREQEKAKSTAAP